MVLRDPRRRASRAVLATLLFASGSVITLDVRGGSESPVAPLRGLAGELFGPVEEVAAAAVRPLAALPGYLRANRSLRFDVARLEAENAALRGRLSTTVVDRNRAAELDGLVRRTSSLGSAVVPARVIGMGPAQSFSSTVTIDAGSSAGVRPDMTVLNSQGLVGRVLRAGTSTATVLLIADADSVVGARLGANSEVGFLRGRSRLGERGRLTLDMVDDSVIPRRGDIVVTWGSRNRAPYVPGVPIGRVTSVYSSPRQLSRRAVIEPLVDFTSLDLVGVVVAQARGDRTVLRAGARNASFGPRR